jgi:Zn-dependent metalloprotease
MKEKRIFSSLLLFLALVLNINLAVAQEFDSLNVFKFQTKLNSLIQDIQPLELIKSTPKDTLVNKIRYSRSKKRVRFIGAPPHSTFLFPGRTKDDIQKSALNFLKEYSPVLGIYSNKVHFKIDRIKPNRDYKVIELQQYYNDIPIFSGEISIQFSNENGGVQCVFSDILYNTDVFDKGQILLVPTITSNQAIQIAIDLFSQSHPKNEFNSSDPILKIFDPEIIGRVGTVCLTWELRISGINNPFIDNVILINAHSGEIIIQIPLVYDALNREIFDAGNTTSDPGDSVRFEGDPVSSITDANLAYDYLGETYDFYWNNHSRDGMNDSGMTVSATVRYCEPLHDCPWPNAGLGTNNRLYFGQGYANGIDIVAHEYTHGVTNFESGLYYLNESGAINESFSDIWGEFIDQTNNQEENWIIGENRPGDPLRSMSNPPSFNKPFGINNPDRKGSPDFYQGNSDNGGVHHNSGVGNKLCYLLTEGDDFNGFSIYGMGIEKVSDLFYEVQTKVLNNPASDYDDLSNALVQAAIILNWSTDDINNLENAIAAVEINNGILIVKTANFIIGKLGSVGVEVIPPESGEYYVGISNQGGGSAPEWDWLADYSSGTPIICSDKLSLDKYQKTRFEFYVKPKDSNATFKFWLYQKDSDNTFFPIDDITYTATAYDSQQDIVELEYFLNADPGFGNATKIQITPSENITEEFNIPLNIQNGFHTLYVRARDLYSKWSFTQNIPFYHLEFTPESNLTKIEYFIDNDPGYGNATSLSIVTSAEITKVFNLELSDLSYGFHTLYIRARDSNGKWSLTKSIPFYKVSIAPEPDLSKIEYFMDDDPGFGNGNILPLSTHEITETFNIDLSTVSTGFHRIYIRAQDQNGNWSLIQTRSFYKIDIHPSPSITEIEYFINNDPGLGSGARIPVFPQGEDISMAFVADLANILEGTHRLYIRVKDSDNKWSIIYSDTIAVTRGPLLIDVDGTLNVCQHDTVLLKAPTKKGWAYSWVKDGDIIPNANDSLYYPVQSGNYSVIVNDNVSYIDTSQIVIVTISPLPSANAGSDTEICSGESVTLTATGGILYTWDNSIANSVPFYPIITTDYHVIVTDEADCSGIDTVTVTVYPLPEIVISEDQIICEGDRVLLTVSGGSSYLWSTGETTSSISVSPSGLTIYPVMVNDENDCSNNDTVTVTVHPLPPVHLGNDSTISTLDTLKLDAGQTFVSYLWNNDSTTQTISIDGSVLGIGTYSYHVVVNDEAGCSNSDTIIIAVESASGLNDLISDNILIYPNPSTGKVNIQIEEYGSNNLLIEVINIVGKSIILKKISKVNNRNTYEIDLSLHSKGIYFIKVYYNDQMMVKKIIIQ